MQDAACTWAAVFSCLYDLDFGKPEILHAESKQDTVLFHLDPEQDTTGVMQSESFACMLHNELSYLPGSAWAPYLGL